MSLSRKIHNHHHWPSSSFMSMLRTENDGWLDERVAIKVNHLCLSLSLLISYGDSDDDGRGGIRVGEEETDRQTVRVCKNISRQTLIQPTKKLEHMIRARKKLHGVDSCSLCNFFCSRNYPSFPLPPLLPPLQSLLPPPTRRDTYTQNHSHLPQHQDESRGD